MRSIPGDLLRRQQMSSLLYKGTTFTFRAFISSFYTFAAIRTTEDMTDLNILISVEAVIGRSLPERLFHECINFASKAEKWRRITKQLLLPQNKLILSPKRSNGRLLFRGPSIHNIMEPLFRLLERKNFESNGFQLPMSTCDNRRLLLDTPPRSSLSSLFPQTI